MVYKLDSSTASYIDFVATLDEDFSSETSLETVGVEHAARIAEKRKANENDKGFIKSNIEKGVDDNSDFFLKKRKHFEEKEYIYYG